MFLLFGKLIGMKCVRQSVFAVCMYMIRCRSGPDQICYFSSLRWGWGRGVLRFVLGDFRKRGSVGFYQQHPLRRWIRNYPKMKIKSLCILCYLLIQWNKHKKNTSTTYLTFRVHRSCVFSDTVAPNYEILLTQK